MNRFIRYFCMVVIPLLMGMLIDYLVGIPDRLIIVLYVIFYGITSYLFGVENCVKSQKQMSKKYIILSIVVMLLSLLALILIKNTIILAVDITLIGIIQVMLSLLLSVSLIILLNVGIKRKISNSEL